MTTPAPETALVLLALLLALALAAGLYGVRDKRRMRRAARRAHRYMAYWLHPSNHLRRTEMPDPVLYYAYLMHCYARPLASSTLTDAECDKVRASLPKAWH